MLRGRIVWLLKMKELCRLLANDTAYRQMVCADEAVVQYTCELHSPALHRMRMDARDDA